MTAALPSLEKAVTGRSHDPLQIPVTPAPGVAEPQSTRGGRIAITESTVTCVVGSFEEPETPQVDRDNDWEPGSRPEGAAGQAPAVPSFLSLDRLTPSTGASSGAEA